MVKVLIIYMSIHHGNTKKVAERIGKALGATMLRPAEIPDPDILKKYDLVGFGSGIYFGKFHRELERFVDSLPAMNGKKAFIFSTSGASSKNFLNKSGMPGFLNKLTGKGFTLVAEFNCLAFDTWGYLGWIGGINKGRPNDLDLSDAEDFAKKLKAIARTPSESGH